LTVEQKDFRITIKQKEEHVTQVVNRPPVQTHLCRYPPFNLLLNNNPQAAPAAEKPKQQAETSADNFVTIKSPMIGTFYRRSGPDKPAFAEVGDDVAPGKIVCIIEAMKLFNEIESEVSGKIVKVLVEDASPVEYDQPLFLVEPS
jgi:acetyl-CoA carboxylase biotin carboxyl carrier protein